MLYMYDMNIKTSQEFPIGFQILHQSLTSSSKFPALTPSALLSVSYDFYFLRPLWFKNDLGIKCCSTFIPETVSSHRTRRVNRGMDWENATDNLTYHYGTSQPKGTCGSDNVGTCFDSFSESCSYGHICHKPALVE